MSSGYTVIHEKFEACLLAGAIGDAWGSSFENNVPRNNAGTFYLGGRPSSPQHWAITDDTQLTLATCEVLAAGPFEPALLAQKFWQYYQERKLTGLGASTLGAIQATGAGIHWSQTGRQGHYAAGNGAAMRIAPFAFYPDTTRQTILDACSITHRNADAYAGALAIYLAIRAAIAGTWTGSHELIPLILPDLPDTSLKDRLVELSRYPKAASIAEAAQLGNDGYVVNSVPFAIFCATKIPHLGLQQVLQHIMDTGGDTDTNASLTGQIAGAFTGLVGIPDTLIQRLALLPEYGRLRRVITATQASIR